MLCSTFDVGEGQRYSPLSCWLMLDGVDGCGVVGGGGRALAL